MTHRQNVRTAPVGAVVLGLALTALVLAPAPAAAQWGWAGRLQMGFGGDELGQVEYSDGSQSSLRLGTIMTLMVGPVYEVWASGPSMVELQGMVGWGGWSTGPENTDDRLRFSRFPVELLGFYGHRLPGKNVIIRAGGGVTYHLGGGVSGTGQLEGAEMAVDNALGYTGEVSVLFGPISTGLRYTQMNPVVVDGAERNGSSFGIFIGFTHLRFPLGGGPAPSR